MGWRQCPKIVEPQGDVDGPLECSLALGVVAAETRGSRGLVLMTLQNYSACKQNTQSDCKQLPTSSQPVLEKFTGADDPRHPLRPGGLVVHGRW